MLSTGNSIGWTPVNVVGRIESASQAEYAGSIPVIGSTSEQRQRCSTTPVSVSQNGTTRSKVTPAAFSTALQSVWSLMGVAHG